MPENTPERTPVNAIESLFEINDVCVGWHVPFLAMFHDLPQCKHVVPTRSSFPKACLFFAHQWSSGGQHYVKNNPTKKTLLVTDSGVIPLQLLHILRSPFFGKFTISPVFQSLGISSTSDIPSKISIEVLTMTYPPAFNISALTPSDPGAFPDFMELTAFLTSSAVQVVGLC